MNPFASTSFYFTTNGTNAATLSQLHTPSACTTQVVNGSNVSTYRNVLILGNTTADDAGNTTIQVVSKRPGALGSVVTIKVLATQVAPLIFTPGNLSVHVTDERGVQVSILTTTPYTSTYYTVCRPSQCQVPVQPTNNATLYTGPVNVNETGTVVLAIGVKANLLPSGVRNNLLAADGATSLVVATKHCTWLHRPGRPEYYVRVRRHAVLRPQQQRALY